MIQMNPSYLLYFIPLLIAISLVYGATRHEDTQKVIAQAWHTAYWITTFLGLIFFMVWLLTIDAPWVVATLIAAAVIASGVTWFIRHRNQPAS